MEKRQFCTDDQLIKLVLIKYSKNVPHIPLFHLQPGGDSVMTISSLHTKLQIWNFQRRNEPLFASYCTILLYFCRYCTVRLKMFSLKKKTSFPVGIGVNNSESNKQVHWN